MKNKLSIIIAIVLFCIGILSLFLTTSIFLNLFDIREKEGNYVLFVVIANFVCSLLFLSASWGLLRKKDRTVKILIIAVFILLFTLGTLGIYASFGGVCELKTFYALIFRIIITLIAIVSSNYILNTKKLKHEKN